MYNTFLEKAVLAFYFLLLLTGVILPSDGEHGILSPKSLAFVLACFWLMGVILLRGRLLLDQFKLVVFGVGALFFLMIWLGVGKLTGTIPLSSQLDQMKLFLVTLAFVLMSLFLYRERTLSYTTFLKVFIYANFTYSTVKLILVLLCFLKVLSVDTLVRVTGIRVMSMSIMENWERFQTSMDLLTPFLIFFVLQGKLLKVSFFKGFVPLYLVISCLATLISFSRVFIFIAFFSILLHVCLSPLHKIIRSLLIMSSAVVLFVGWMGVGNVAKMVEVRLFSQENKESDEIRVSQTDALTRELRGAPLFGMGLGGFAPDVIRDDKLLHSYEVQWIAFAAQFGFLGLAIITLPLVWIASLYLQPQLDGFRVCMLALLGGWITAGFTNPFLISLSSGIVYALFILTAKRWRELRCE